MKRTAGCRLLSERSVRNSFFVTMYTQFRVSPPCRQKKKEQKNSHGHPQYRRKNTRQGPPSIVGNFNLTWVCALSPILGGARIGVGGGGGVCHDVKALGTPHWMLAKGFWKGVASCWAVFELFDGEVSVREGRVTFPRPALWRTSLVVSLLNMVG